MLRNVIRSLVVVFSLILVTLARVHEHGINELSSRLSLHFVLQVSLLLLLRFFWNLAELWLFIFATVVYMDS